MNTLGLTEISGNSEFYIDLQRFADKDSPTGQKTEDATPKRRQDARNEGQVAKSQELNTVIVLMAGFLGLRLFGGYITNSLIGFITLIYENMCMEFHDSSAAIVGEMSLFIIFMTLLPFLMIMLLAALLINYAQVGLLFTLKPLQFDLKKMNPVSGMKKFFNTEALFKLFKALLKLVILCIMPYNTLRRNVARLSMLGLMDLSVSVQVIVQISNRLALEMIAVLFVLALIDYIYQRHKYEESIKMSKYDVKQERKQQEGDPKIKSQQRQRMRQTLMQAMKQHVPEADVVITNPIHLAIALKWQDNHGEYTAPWVVAKGAGLMAENIKKIARENGIPVRENKPLAQSLYKMCEIGDQIPEELYKVVSEVLAAVYRAGNRYQGGLNNG